MVTSNLWGVGAHLGRNPSLLQGKDLQREKPCTVVEGQTGLNGPNGRSPNNLEELAGTLGDLPDVGRASVPVYQRRENRVRACGCLRSIPVHVVIVAENRRLEE